jgi:hypothetical protein
VAKERGPIARKITPQGCQDFEKTGKGRKTQNAAAEEKASSIIRRKIWKKGASKTYEKSLKSFIMGVATNFS